MVQRGGWKIEPTTQPNCLGLMQRVTIMMEEDRK
jgi:hypothetical protein